ncbi:DUF6783 domain-containing protein [Dysosmobacter sp.]
MPAKYGAHLAERDFQTRSRN